MDQRAREYINQTAELILKKLEIQVPITDIDQVVAQLGGRIEAVDGPLRGNRIRRLEGEEEAFVITVMRRQSPYRRRFSIAQELGHLFLHRGYMSDWALWERFDDAMAMEEHAEKEFQANEFAANFLMPKKEYLEFVAKHGENNQIDACYIGEYFGVPESAASIRGKLVGALRWA